MAIFRPRPRFKTRKHKTIEASMTRHIGFAMQVLQNCFVQDSSNPVTRLANYVMPTSTLQKPLTDQQVQVVSSALMYSFFKDLRSGKQIPLGEQPINWFSGIGTAIQEAIGAHRNSYIVYDNSIHGVSPMQLTELINFMPPALKKLNGKPVRLGDALQRLIEFQWVIPDVSRKMMIEYGREFNYTNCCVS